MKKKYVVTVSAIALSLSLAACGGNSEQNKENTNLTEPPMAPKEGANNELPSTTETPVEVNSSGGTFHADTIPSKIKGGFYGSGDRLLVTGDQLYLYDTRKDEVLASVPIVQDQLSVKSFDTGYLATGFETNDITCILYDDVLQETRHIKLSDLVKDDFVLPTAVAVSPDGTHIAFAGMRGIYLFNIQQQSTETLLKFNDVGVNGTKISLVQHLEFTADGNKVVFVGLGNTVPIIDGEEGFSIYGYISTDGSNQKLIKKDSYKVEDIEIHGNTMFMPQNFANADGTFLIADATTGDEKLLHFDGAREGKDGVFVSSQGGYVATASLGDDMTIRVYDTQSGKLLHKEIIPNNGQDHFYRVPQVLLLDGSQTGIVFMGHSIDGLETLTTTFEF